MSQKYVRRLYDEWCMRRFNITEESVHTRPTYRPEYRYTLIKEMAGEKYLARYNVFQKFFGDDCVVEQITDPDMQKRGADFKVTVDGKDLYVDLKSCVGPDYLFKPESCVDIKAGAKIRDMSLPVEITQYNRFTNKLHSKLTDYFIYVVIDDNHDCAFLVPFEKVFEVAKQHYVTPFNSHPITYTLHRSSNGSAVYVNVPSKTVAIDKVFTRRPKSEHF